MKLIASIPVEAVKSPGRLSFRHENLEVEAVRILRHPATRFPHLNRWHYEADVDHHPRICAEAIRTGVGGAYRVRVDRRLNPKWKPPIFFPGSNSMKVK